MMDKSNRKIILIIHNVRSAHNVGSLLRTADGLGIQRVYLSGYTPYPKLAKDDRLPHIAERVDSQIHKTALGAETTVNWQKADIESLLEALPEEDYLIAALEQTSSAIRLDEFKPPQRIALVIGNEINGLEPRLLRSAATHLEIPMLGAKESFNVAAAAAMALYHLRFS